MIFMDFYGMMLERFGQQLRFYLWCSGVHVRLSGHMVRCLGGMSQHSQPSPHAKIWWVLFLHQHAGLASPFGNAITS